MSKEKEPYFVEQYNPIDEIESTHSELLRSKDYSNEELYTLGRLEELGLYWMEEEDNPIRSERSKAVCKQITKRLSFECAYRSGRVPLLVDYYTKNSEVELAA